MVVKYSRAERRRHTARMKSRAKFIIETQWWFMDMESYLEERDIRQDIVTVRKGVMALNQRVNRMYNNMKVCSCHMCCNVRRSNWAESPLTLQELRALDAFNDGLDDYYVDFND